MVLWLTFPASSPSHGRALHDMIGRSECFWSAHQLQGFPVHAGGVFEHSSLCGGWCCSLSLRHGRRCRCPRRRPRRPCCPRMGTGTAWTCAHPARCPSRKTRAFTARAAAAPVSEHRCGALHLCQFTTPLKYPRYLKYLLGCCRYIAHP